MNNTADFGNVFSKMFNEADSNPSSKTEMKYAVDKIKQLQEQISNLNKDDRN